MANVTTYRNDATPQTEQGVFVIKKTITLPASGINNADTVEVFRFPPSYQGRIMDVIQIVSATLGAGATVQARIDRSGAKTVLAAASTAGAASKTTAVAQTAVPFDVQGNDTVELLIGGANVSASATVTLHLEVAPVGSIA